jgi:hypothetical protein
MTESIIVVFSIFLCRFSSGPNGTGIGCGRTDIQASKDMQACGAGARHASSQLFKAVQCRCMQCRMCVCARICMHEASEMYLVAHDTRT